METSVLLNGNFCRYISENAPSPIVQSTLDLSSLNLTTLKLPLLKKAWLPIVFRLDGRVTSVRLPIKEYAYVLLVSLISANA